MVLRYMKYRIEDFDKMSDVDRLEAIRLEGIRRVRIDWFYEWGIPIIIGLLGFISIFVVLLL